MSISNCPCCGSKVWIDLETEKLTEVHEDEFDSGESDDE